MHTTSGVAYKSGARSTGPLLTNLRQRHYGLFVTILARIETWPRPSLTLVGLALVVLIGELDYLTGNELSFSIFYALPIALATWCNSKRLGLVLSLASACAWYAADMADGDTYSHPLIPVWNMFIRLAFFVIITFLLTGLKSALQRETHLARSDALTGAMNTRSFYEIAERESLLLRRYGHPFTVAYLDLDNFKAVNDQFGHAIGDQVLRATVDVCTENLRRTDVVARLGGDEFALLLPETDLPAARSALTSVQSVLLKTMDTMGWPITFSVGALTCRVAPGSVDELLRLADALMYQVKHDHKNAIAYATYDGQPT